MIQPHPEGRVTSVQASYDSLYGRHEVHWEVTESGGFQLQVKVPANTTATVHVPGHHAVSDASLTASYTSDRQTVSFQVGSGTWVFTSQLARVPMLPK
ncbi:hypothetical protein FHS19_000840 [Paenibacillus rhizosphaerae]|uniref:Alpha-L-rhamnosidase C-terminal domain-containing protein n=1 Tax=Paenibacillus rhizosphaerae TaxID=297318 RepID=A0A839TH85_9BACL|nr:hypothetical protein [Paenibacillus rhizosphaerae]